MWASLFLAGCVLTAQADPATAAGDHARQLEVQRLVGQLDAPELASREAAEARLAAMGPEVLPLLPPVNERTPAEVRLRLGRVRQRLQQAAAEAFARASTVTLRAEAMPLSRVLAAISEQTGNRIIDYRRRFGHEVTDPPLTLAFDKTPFWPALDQVLDRAGLTVYPHGEDRAIYVVRRGEDQRPRVQAASYSGPLRVAPVSVVARRDLLRQGPAAEALILALEIAWEPRLRPIRLRQPLADISAMDEQGRPLNLTQKQGELEVPVRATATAVELPLAMALPPRSVGQIARLRGTLAALVPGKIEEFRFDNPAAARNVRQRIAGTTVTLVEARRGGQLWEVEMRVRFDQPGEALESHRGWIFQNEAYLQRADGRKIAFERYETRLQTADELGIAYFFQELPPGARFVYKTPGVLVEAGLDYELRGIKLP